MTTIRNGTVATTTNAPSGAAGALGNATSSVQMGDGTTTGSDNLAFILAPTGGTSANRTFSINNYGNTVTLGGSNTSGTTTFGGAIALNRELTLSSATGGTVTYSNVLSGTGGVVAAGTGMTNLNGTRYLHRHHDIAQRHARHHRQCAALRQWRSSAIPRRRSESAIAAPPGGNNLSLLLTNATDTRSLDRDITVNNYGATVTLGGTNTSGTNTFTGDIALAKSATHHRHGRHGGVHGRCSRHRRRHGLRRRHDHVERQQFLRRRDHGNFRHHPYRRQLHRAWLHYRRHHGELGRRDRPVGKYLGAQAEKASRSAARGLAAPARYATFPATISWRAISRSAPPRRSAIRLRVSMLTLSGVISGVQNLTTAGAGEFSLRGANTIPAR